MSRSLKWKTVSPGYEVSRGFRAFIVRAEGSGYALYRSGVFIGRYETADEAKDNALRIQYSTTTGVSG